MGLVIEFRAGESKLEEREATAKGEIIIFPGVRRERMIETETEAEAQMPKPKRRARPKRDRLELPD